MMEDYFSKKQVQNHRLKELLGHTPMQVYGGLVLGVLVGLIFYR
jgi:acid phosphatase family membrane protein YuiD